MQRTTPPHTETENIHVYIKHLQELVLYFIKLKQFFTYIKRIILFLLYFEIGKMYFLYYFCLCKERKKIIKFKTAVCNHQGALALQL